MKKIRKKTRKTKVRKPWILLLALAMTASLCACGESSPFSEIGEDCSIKLPLYEMTGYNIRSLEYEYSDFVFNELGQVTEKKESGDSSGTITYTYDDQGRVLTETDTNYYGYETNTYTYNEDGTIATLSESSDFSVRDGNVFAYTYERDDMNRVVRETVVNTTSEDRYTNIYDYEYDEYGNVIRETQTSPTSVYVLECAYDNMGHRISESVTAQDGEVTVNHYTYECVDYLTMSPQTHSELAAPANWTSFESQETLPVPSSCVTTITEGTENMYRLPGDKESAYLEYLKYQTILTDLCGFTLEPDESGVRTTVLKDGETAAVMSIGYDADGYLLNFSFEA